MTVLYVVGLNAATSIPLEVAEKLYEKSIDLRIAVYYRDVGRHLGVRWERVDHIDSQGALDLSAMVRLALLVSKVRPDVVHVHHTLSGLVATVAARIFRIPVVVKTEHNDHSSFNFPRNLFNAITLALVDRIITNSDSTRYSFGWWEQLLYGSKATTVYNGVDVGRIRSARRSGWSERKKLGVESRSWVIGSVGRLIKQKNYPVLIRAVREVVDTGFDVGIVLVGGGPRESQLKKLVQKLDLEDRVKMTGWTDRDTVYRMIYAMDVFVVCSLWEGFCNAAVEAMCAGRPLLCSSIDTLREVVGDPGRYVKPGSSSALAEGIIELVSLSEAERERLGRAASDRATRLFSVERTAIKYLEVYREELAGSSRRS